MEELKMLVDMVAHLPQMALWVALGFWAYKVIVIGSVYGVIRFVVDKTHSWLTTPKHELKKMEIRPMLDGMAITGQTDALIAQLHRLRSHVNGGSSGLTFMHANSVEWLRAAIDEKIERETETMRKASNVQRL